MNFPFYITTNLEDWVSQWYVRWNIKTPKQLKAVKIAKMYNIFLHRKPTSPHYEVFGRYKAITLDSRAEIKLQKEQFFHELCHIIRHHGNQTMMLETFRELQERDAMHFTRYAALPYHMITRYDFNDPNIVNYLSEDFCVTEELCLERLLQIERRAKQNNCKPFSDVWNFQ